MQGNCLSQVFTDLPFHCAQQIYIVGTHLADGDGEEGNLFTVPSNKLAEFNFFLDPKAGKIVVESGLDITLIPLRAQRQVSSFEDVLKSLRVAEKTPESSFVYQLLLLMQKLQKEHHAFSHIVSCLYSSALLTAIVEYWT